MRSMSFSCVAFLAATSLLQAVFDFLLQHNNKLFFFVSELLNLLLAHRQIGKDQPQADQTNSLAKGVDPQRSTKLARKLHAHSVQHAYKLTTIRRAIETKSLDIVLVP
eukprot:1137197-Pelagomonas_calceolata.AAC.3